MFKCKVYVLVADLRLTCIKVGDISRSPRGPFEYFGEPFSNLISLDNKYLGKTIYFPETESIIWRMVLFISASANLSLNLNLCLDEYSSVLYPVNSSSRILAHKQQQQQQQKQQQQRWE